jgi:hypothetical protein
MQKTDSSEPLVGADSAVPTSPPRHTDECPSQTFEGASTPGVTLDPATCVCHRAAPTSPPDECDACHRVLPVCCDDANSHKWCQDCCPNKGEDDHLPEDTSLVRRITEAVLKANTTAQADKAVAKLLRGAAPTSTPLDALIAKWRGLAQRASGWADDAEKQDDGANAHAFRKERRIWNTCADELEKLLAASPASALVTGEGK